MLGISAAPTLPSAESVTAWMRSLTPPLLVASTTMPSSLPVVSLNSSTKLSKATFWEPL